MGLFKHWLEGLDDDEIGYESGLGSSKSRAMEDFETLED